MKKLLLVLGMATCIFGMTACGSAKDETETRLDITEDGAIQYAQQLIDNMQNIVVSGAKDQYTDAVEKAALDSWELALQDLGEYQSATINKEDVEIGSDKVTIVAYIDGTEHDGNVEIILEDQNGSLMLTSATANIKYSMGELMEKAALNTVLGMGTVFIVLILISLLISCFVFIPKLQAAFTKKPETAPETVKPAAPAPAAVTPVEAVQEEDDSELIAVIAAAIAASEGAVSADGYVVRSIRRHSNTNNWKRNY